jgi:hypothetical protein
VMQALATMKTGNAARSDRWTAQCGNPHCETGWLQLFRNQSFPRFEGKWACSTRCMERIVADIVRSRIESWEPGIGMRALRMPLGLILLSRGWITRQELREALAAQRRAGDGRIGEWLRRMHGIQETAIAKALAIQWNCAVLPSGAAGVEFAPFLVPTFLRQHYGFVLLRQESGAAFYLAGKYSAEHAAAQAMEHMLGAPVQAAFLEDRAWSAAENGRADPGELYCGRDGVAAGICKLVEEARPADARLARVHDHLWLRMWLRRDRRMQTQDAIFPLRSGTEADQAARPAP